MYKIAEHKDYFLNSSEDTRKQFDMVKKLSKGFTVENKIALDLDEMLMQWKELDNPGSTSSTPPTPVKSPVAPTKTANKKANASSGASDSSGSLQRSFEQLFDALKDQVAPATSVDRDSMKDILHEILKESKIRYGDLDSDVQKRFSNLPVTIRYELPERPLPAFELPPIGAFQQMVDDVMLGNNLFLVGGAGTGKTFTAENLIAKAALDRPHITINCSQWTSPTEIIGGQTMDGYVEGKLIEAWKNGWVLILDELPKIDPNTAGLFNDALSKTKLSEATIFNARKERFKKHKDFACIATGNIYPDKESMSYGANNKQDLSLLDRFSGSVYFVEKNPVIERQIVMNDMVWSICDKMRSVIEDLKYEAQLSLRFMQTARDAYALEMSRLNTRKSNAVSADSGKNFKNAVDSYLSTFTEIQQSNIKSRISYPTIFSNYKYRSFDINKSVY